MMAQLESIRAKAAEADAAEAAAIAAVRREGRESLGTHGRGKWDVGETWSLRRL